MMNRTALAFETDRFSEFFGEETTTLSASLLNRGACNSNYLVGVSREERFVCRTHKGGTPKPKK